MPDRILIWLDFAARVGPLAHHTAALIRSYAATGSHWVLRQAALNARTLGTLDDRLANLAAKSLSLELDRALAEIEVEALACCRFHGHLV